MLFNKGNDISSLILVGLRILQRLKQLNICKLLIVYESEILDFKSKIENYENLTYTILTISEDISELSDVY